MEYLSFWQQDAADLQVLKPHEHPAYAVLQYLASGNTEHNELNRDHLESWFERYAKKRGGTAVFKPLKDCVSRLKRSHVLRLRLTVSISSFKLH